MIRIFKFLLIKILLFFDFKTKQKQKKTTFESANEPE